MASSVESTPSTVETASVNPTNDGAHDGEAAKGESSHEESVLESIEAVEETPLVAEGRTKPVVMKEGDGETKEPVIPKVYAESVETVSTTIPSSMYRIHQY